MSLPRPLALRTPAARPRGPRARARRAATALLLVAGCARAPEPRRIDLLELLPQANAWGETAKLDLGTPEARRRLWSGWGRDVSSPPTWVSTREPSASLLLRTLDERPLDLELRARGTEGPVSVTVRLGTAELGRLHFGADWSHAVLPLPAHRPASGEQLLSFDVERAPGSEGRRPARLEVDSVALRGGWHTLARARALEDRGGLELPVGTAVDFALAVPATAALAWDRIEAVGGAQAALEVVAWRDGGPSRRRRFERRGGARVELDSAGEPELVISLRALPLADALRGTLAVRGLRVEVRGAPPASPPVALALSGAPVPRPNFLVYLVDTLRADRLGVYGYRLGTSPAIDRFAAESVVFDDARAECSWTRPAVATLLTGFPPPRARGRRREMLSPLVPTLAERLRAAGYATAMVTANPNTRAQIGFGRGFDESLAIAERPGERREDASSWSVNRLAFEWLGRRPAERPFLLVLHSIDPHTPYAPAREFAERFAPGTDRGLGTFRAVELTAELEGAERERRMAAASRLYDASIAETDENFGALLGELARGGLERTTVVLFVSDHGEEFLEHGGVGHGRSLYQELLHVPMIWRVPGSPAAGRRIAGPASQRDVVPTMLELAGIAADPELPGISLVPSLERAEAPPERPTFAWLHDFGLDLFSIQHRDSKLIRSAAHAQRGRRPHLELYELGADPAEGRNRVLERPAMRGFLEVHLRLESARWRSSTAAPQLVTDPQLAAELRALGYL